MGGVITTYGASARLGSLMPARALMRLGYDARTYSTAGDAAPAEEALRAAKRVVLGELFADSQGWEGPVKTWQRLAASVEDRQDRLVLSIADDHFDNPHWRDFYAEFLPQCAAATTVSERLADMLRKYTSRPVHVAPEPVEGNRGAPHAIAARRLAAPLAWLGRKVGLTTDLWRVRLLWYGHPANLAPFLELVPALETFARSYPLLVSVITTPVAEIAALLTEKHTHPEARLRMHFVPWTPFALDEAMGIADLVIIPSEHRNRLKQAKSPNRLVAGLHGGRFVVAHPLPAYQPYGEFAWLGEDLCEGLAWAIRHPREVAERIQRGQAYIDERHSPEAVARFWLDVFHPKN
jgi:hypothetical protein